MAITTYAELQVAVANWLDRSDLTTRIPEFIAMAEAQVNRTLRITRMINQDTAILGTDNRYSSVPDDYLEAITYTVSRTADRLDPWRLEPAPIAVLAGYRAANDGPRPPRFYATMSLTGIGRDFEHYPTPDTNYYATLNYYARLPALSNTVASNWLLADAPDAYLYGALLQAAPFLRDAEYAQVWNAGFQNALDGLRSMDRTPAGKLRTDTALSSRSGRYDINRDI